MVVCIEEGVHGRTGDPHQLRDVVVDEEDHRRPGRECAESEEGAAEKGLPEEERGASVGEERHGEQGGSWGSSGYYPVERPDAVD